MNDVEKSNYVEIHPVIRARIMETLEAAGILVKITNTETIKERLTPELIEEMVQQQYQSSSTSYRTEDEVLSDVLKEYLRSSDLEELQKIVEFPKQWFGIHMEGKTDVIVLVGNTGKGIPINIFNLRHFAELTAPFGLVEIKHYPCHESVVSVDILSLWDVVREIRKMSTWASIMSLSVSENMIEIRRNC